MAEQLNPEQIADYKRLLENEKKEEKINEHMVVACAVGTVVGGAIGSVGHLPGIIGGGIVGCATGDGLVDIYHKSGAYTAIETGKNTIDGLKEHGDRILKELNDKINGDVITVPTLPSGSKANYDRSR